MTTTRELKVSGARLEVNDALGRRVVEISKALFEIGRRETNDLRLAGSEVSRDHADIVTENGKIAIRDKNSRYGTYVNGEQVTESVLVPGDRIRLGRSGGAEMVFGAAIRNESSAKDISCSRLRPCRHARLGPGVPLEISRRRLGERDRRAVDSYPRN